MFSDYVSPICLPADEWFQNYSLDEGFMEVAGWGIDNIGSNKLCSFAYSTTRPVIIFMSIRYSLLPLPPHKQKVKGSISWDKTNLCLRLFSILVSMASKMLAPTLKYK